MINTKKLVKLLIFTKAFSAIGTAAPSLLQDVDVYTDGKFFFARGRIDQKIIKQSKDAGEVIQAGLDSISEVGGETCFKNIFVGNNINKCTHGDISSKGKESVVGENLSHLPLSHHGKIQPANPAEHIYQFFDTRYLETFIEE